MKKFIVYSMLSITCMLFSFISNAQDTITTASGLKYIRTKEGDGIHPKPGQTVKVIYTGKFTSGKLFDTNKGGPPFKFKINNHEVIPGWDEAVQLMSKGEKGIFIIPAPLAYGEKGVKDPNNDARYMVPPNSTLIFEIEIIDVH